MAFFLHWLSILRSSTSQFPLLFFQEFSQQLETTYGSAPFSHKLIETSKKWQRSLGKANKRDRKTTPPLTNKVIHPSDKSFLIFREFKLGIMTTIFLCNKDRKVIISH
jgi:hypothetical protein